LAEEDYIEKVSRQLQVGLTMAKLPPQEVAEVNGFAQIVNLNRTLRSIPEVDAKIEFQKLNPEVQEILVAWDPEAVFAENFTFKQSMGQRILGGRAFKGLRSYSEGLSEPTRAALISNEKGTNWSRSWELAKDGEAVFNEERARKVDEFYGPHIAKIARGLSAGKTFGEVLATLDTSNEKELDAAIRALQDDKIFKQALKDYKTTKFSSGREFAWGIVQPEPGEFGLKRLGYNLISGVGDLGVQIFFDPITYIPFAGAGYKLVSLSIMGVAKAAAKLAPKGSKEFAEFFAKGIDKAFDHPVYGASINRFYNTVGPQIQKYAQGNPTEKIQAYSILSRRFGKDLTDESIQQLAKHKVFDASAARQFLKDADTASLILQGRTIKAQPVLPTYSVIRKIRTDMLIGLTKPLSKLPTPGSFDYNGTGVSALMSGVKGLIDNPAQIKQIEDAAKETNTLVSRFARLWEINPSARFLEVGKSVEKIGKNLYKTVDNGLKSTKVVVSLARIAGLSRPMADEIGVLWNNASVGQRINIRDGLALLLAKSLNYTKSGSDDLKRIVDDFVKPGQSYSAEIEMTSAIFKTLPKSQQKIILASGAKLDDGAIRFNPSTWGDNQGKAVLEYQLSTRVALPPVHEWIKLSYQNKNFFWRSMGQIFNGKVSEAMVSGWAALTLLPRLGIRSVLEEAMMFGLVNPLSTIKAYIGSGFKTSVMLRVIKQTGGDNALKLRGDGTYFDPNGLGLFTRTYFRFIAKGKYDNIVKRAKEAKTADEIADLLAETVYGTRVFPKSKNKVKDAEYIKDWVRYGWGRRSWEDVTLSNSYAQVAWRNKYLQNQSYGDSKGVAQAQGTEIAPWLMDKKAIQSSKLVRDEQFRDLSFNAGNSDAYYFSLTNEIIKRAEFGGKTTELAILNMDNPGKAVDLIANYLRKNKQVREKFANYYGVNGVNENKLANSIYWATREVFAKRNGDISKDILNLVRTKNAAGKVVINKNIDVSDLKKISEDNLPRTILSQAYIPVVKDVGSLLKSFVEKGYSVMDRQISMLAREPMFFANYHYYRKNLEGIQSLRYNKLVNNGIGKKEAETLASRYASELATDLASKRTLDFIDNPLIRTNLAFNLRNIARFYRATEDFWRRAYRATVRNPQSIIRLRLASDGLDHSGFIYQDENNEKYFIFPTDNFINAAFAKATWMLNRNTPYEPVPLEFTGKIKFLTPSLDPEATIPSLSGPTSGIALLALKQLMPEHWKVRESIAKATLGPSRGSTVTYWDVALPSNVRRFYAAFIDRDETDSQWASASRKAAAALEATGKGLVPDGVDENGNPTVSEAAKEQYTKRITAIGLNVITIRFFLGLVSPVTPGVGVGKDVPDYLKDQGTINFKSDFIKLVTELTRAGSEDPWNEAVLKYDAINPGLVAYTIPESEINKVATVRRTKQAGRWIRENKDIVRDYPQGAMFFVPSIGEFDYAEFDYLAKEGYIKYLPIEEFVRAVNVASSKQRYYELSRFWDEQIEKAQPGLKSRVRERAQQEKESFKKSNPLLAEELNTGKSRVVLENSLNDLRKLVDSDRAPNTNLTSKYKEMISLFDEYERLDSMLILNNTQTSRQRDAYRQITYQQMLSIAKGDPQLESIVEKVFKELIGV
jgi:hypothetical protein